MLNARHIERGQPDHLDRFANRWATVSPADTEPPVDEDAEAEARAYERGRADATRDAAKQLCALGLGFDAWRIEENERARLAAKQGAASS